MRIRNSLLALAAMLFAVLPAQAGAQTNSNAAAVSLSMSVQESITVTATPASVVFTYSPAAGGTATASAPIAWTTTAQLGSGHTFLATYAFFASSTAALTNGSQSIPASEVFAAMNGGTAAACTASVSPPNDLGGGAYCGSNIAYTATPAAGQTTQSGTALLSLANLGNLVPGSYTGTLTFQAEAN
jgi:hypothetical protein